MYKSFDALPPEAWRSLTGDDVEQAPLRDVYSASGLLARCVDVCADSLAALPFDILDARGDVVDDSENYQNAVGVLPDIQRTLWMLEASIKIFGAAYLYNEPSAVRGRTARIRVLSPAALSVRISDSGELTYTRKDARQTQIPAALITPIWEPDPYVELGAPLSSTASRAAMAAGVLVSVDKFATRFFERGAIKGTIFGIDTANRVEREKFQSWVERLFAGIGNAWRQAVFNLRDVKPIVVGEGLESLANNALSREKTEAVLMTFGIPASLLLANAANYATAQQDKKNFYSDLIIPDSAPIAAAINSALGKIPQLRGYKLQFAPSRLPIMSETNAEKAKAALGIASVLAHGAVGLISLKIAGYPLSDEQISEIESALAAAEKRADARDGKSGDSRGEGAQASPSALSKPPQGKLDESGDIAKWRAKAMKSLAKSGRADCKFASDAISPAARAIIESELPRATSTAAVEAVFSAAQMWSNYP